MKLSTKISKKQILTSSLTNFAASHPRLLSIAIYAGVAFAISAAMGFVLYPEQQLAFAMNKSRLG